MSAAGVSGVGFTVRSVAGLVPARWGGELVVALFEIRPITVEDLPDLFRHVRGPDLDTAEVTVDYAANLDGPWPRSRRSSMSR